MVTDIKKTNAEELSYLDIVRRNGNIKIPLIQRDYAQGRPGKRVKAIREKFIKDLFNALINEKKLSLDFIYGATDDKKFIPLDGQQRLTTLFLIHIYLDGLRGETDGVEQLNYIFTYETRDSSRLFCEKIIENRHQLFGLSSLSIRKNTKGDEYKPSPSSIIKDQSWWLKKWSADPTIESMLCMLDTIDSIFFNEWQKAATNLFSACSSYILFQFLKLENFYDPDDLFIKMNARGLPLTDFEIFKGKWMEQIEANYPPERVKELKSLIDVNWTDFLWPMRKFRESLKNIDPYFQNLLKFIIGNSVASLSNKGHDFDILFEANDKELSFSYGKYVDEYGVIFNKSLLDRINDELSVMCSHNSIFNRFRTNSLTHKKWIDLDKEWQDFIIQDRRSKTNYPGRINLYALSQFSLIIPNASDRDVDNWTRLIRNLVENTRIDSPADTINAIKDIDNILGELAVYYSSIPDIENGSDISFIDAWCAQSLFTPRGFSKSQWEEEKIKSELRKDKDWNNEITEAEQHPYLKGKIGLILWCAGEVTSTTPFSKDTLKRDINSFRSYKEKCLRLFDEARESQSEVISKYLLVRAMLAYGDYMPNLSACRKNIYNNPGHRDYSWRALFRINDTTHIDACVILKHVLDDTYYDAKDVTNSLKKIIKKHRSKNMPLWRRILTSEYGESILSYSRQGYIAFDENDPLNVLVYGSSKRSGYHSELNILYLELLLKRFRPNISISVTWNMGKEDHYTISINENSLSYWSGKWYNDTTEISKLPELVSYIKKII